MVELIDFPVSNLPSRILMQLSNKADEKLIKRFLSDEYQFMSAPADLTRGNFDLCILNRITFKSYLDQIMALKKQKDPLFLPFILLVGQEEVPYLTQSEWQLADDILTIPISPQALQIRINTLTKLNQRSQELQKQNALAYKAINATETGILIIDVRQNDFPVVYCNAALEKVVGYECDQITGKNYLHFLDSEHNAKAIEQLREALKAGKPTQVTLQNPKTDGTTFWSKLSLTPINDEHGKLEYFVGVQNDLTNFFQNQDKLKELVSEKETLLQEVHHRIKNNLAVIAALLEMKKFDTENESTLTFIQEFMSRIMSIAKVHEQLYEQENLSRINFDDYIRRLVQHLYNTYDDRSTEVSVSYDLEPVYLNLRQAVPCGMLINELVTNALKHAFKDQPTGKIHIRLIKTDQISVTVSDNGAGLNKFSESENMTKNFANSIVFTLLQQLEATSSYQSDNGLTFEFSFLPVDQDDTIQDL